MECKKTCGKLPWCCSVGMSWLPDSMGKSNQRDGALLYIWRNKKIYRVDTPSFQGILAINEEKCIHIGKNGQCSIHDNKPWYCKQFPDSASSIGLCVLPKKCSARNNDCIILENLQELHERDLK